MQWHDVTSIEHLNCTCTFGNLGWVQLHFESCNIGNIALSINIQYHVNDKPYMRFCLVQGHLKLV